MKKTTIQRTPPRKKIGLKKNDSGWLKWVDQEEKNQKDWDEFKGDKRGSGEGDDEEETL